MSCKITRQACAAFMAGKDRNLGNTAICAEPGLVVMFLHGNAIARLVGEQLQVRTCGWATTTTKERLNGLLSTHRVYTHQHTLHMQDAPWEGHEDWTSVPPQ